MATIVLGRGTIMATGSSAVPRIITRMNDGKRMDLIIARMTKCVLRVMKVTSVVPTIITSTWIGKIMEWALANLVWKV